MFQRQNPGTPPPIFDSVYTKQTNVSGTATFPTLYKGTYNLTVKKFGFIDYIQNNIVIMGDMTFDVVLSQIKSPPRNLNVNDTSLLCKWDKPLYQIPIFTEAWTSGSLATNAWVASASNWQIYAGVGNLAPSVGFNYLPEVYNYDIYLTSKAFNGVSSPEMVLKYDIYLSNYALTNENTLTVELWNGTTWTPLKSYTNMNGSFNWKTETLDISAVANINGFKIRFHAAGVDSYDINNWNLDNITIVAQAFSTNNPCVLGYNGYLNNVQFVFTTDTFTYIPPTMVIYNQSFTFCVNSVWGSGTSAKVCKTFTSHFLCPVTNLTAIPVTNAAYLTWSKPQCAAATNQCFIYDDGTMENGLAINPGFSDWLGNYYPIAAYCQRSIAQCGYAVVEQCSSNEPELRN